MISCDTGEKSAIPLVLAPDRQSSTKFDFALAYPQGSFSSAVSPVQQSLKQILALRSFYRNAQLELKKPFL
jgi:hypothetical protein